MDTWLCVRQDPRLTAYVRLCLCASLSVPSVTLRVPVDDCALSLWIPVHVCGCVYLSHEGRPSLGLSVPAPHGPMAPLHVGFPLTLPTPTFRLSRLGTHTRAQGCPVRARVTGPRSASSRVCSQILTKPQICPFGRMGEKATPETVRSKSECLHVRATVTVRGRASPPPPRLPSPVKSPHDHCSSLPLLSSSLSPPPSPGQPPLSPR